MTQEEFTMEQICEYAKDNAEGIILATISYLNSKGVDTDEWIAHVGEKFAPGWDSMKDENVLEVGREAALNWISCGANLVSLSGDDTYAEAILEWPSEDSVTYFGISEDDGHKINNVFIPITKYLGLNFTWKSEGNQFKILFSK